MARSPMSIQIDKTLQENFKAKCKEKSLKYSDVAEALLQSFVNGEIDVHVETKYTVKPKNL